MDLNWERSYPFYEIGVNEIKALFPQLAKHQAITLQKIQIGCRNSNYLLSAGQSKYLLRISSEDLPLFSNEISLNKDLTKLVKCPQLLDYKFKNLRFFLLYEYIPGENLSKYLTTNKLSANHINQVAASLANIHSFDQKGDYVIRELDLPPFQSWYDYFLSNPKTLQLLGDKRSNYIKSVIQEHPELLEQITNYTSFIHSDFRPANMIITPSDQIYYVDWEYCTIGHSLADMGQFFRYSSSFNANDLSLFANTYNSIATTKIPPNWYPLARLRDLINPLQLLGSVEKKLQQEEDLLKVIDEIIEELAYTSK